MKTATSTNRSRINQTNTVVPSILKNYAIDSLIHRSNIKSNKELQRFHFLLMGQYLNEVIQFKIKEIV